MAIGDLFNSGEAGARWEVDKSTLWQDTGKTTAVTGDGDPVVVIEDKSGNDHDLTVISGNATYNEAGGVPWIEFTNDAQLESQFGVIAQPLSHAFGITTPSALGSTLRVFDKSESGFVNDDRQLFQTSDSGAWEMYASQIEDISGHTPSTDTDYQLVAFYNGSSSEFYVNGTQFDSGSIDPGTNSIDGIIIANSRGQGLMWTGRWHGHIVIDRQFTSQETTDITSHYDSIQTDGLNYFSGATTTTLVFDQGSYSVTGQDIGFVQTDILSFNQGDYAVTGQDIGFVQVQVLQFEQGSYTITDSEVDTVTTDIFQFEQGTYTLTGQDIGLIITHILEFGQGAYVVTGNDIGFNIASQTVMSFEAGNYSVTGNDIDLVQRDILAFEQGNYSINGQDINLVERQIFQFEQGEYVITGYDISIRIEDSPEILILVSEITTDLELDSTITTELELDSEI